MFWRKIILFCVISLLATACAGEKSIPTTTVDEETLREEVTAIPPTAIRETPIPKIPTSTAFIFDTPTSLPTPKYPGMVLERILFQNDPHPLPPDVPWILVDNKIIALSESMEEINLDYHVGDSSSVSPYSLHVSSSGDQIAYSLQRRIVLEDLSTGSHWHYFYTTSNLWPEAPKFSPDGTKLMISSMSPMEGIYFLSWIDLQTGEFHPLYEYSPEKGRVDPLHYFDPATLIDFKDILGGVAFFPVSWTPLGIFGQIALPFSDAGSAGIIQVEPFTESVVGFPVSSVREFLPSNDGKHVAYLQGKDLRDAELFYQLNLINAQTLQEWVLIPGEAAVFSPEAWSPDNTRLLVRVSLDLDTYTIEGLDLVDRITSIRSRILFESDSPLGRFEQAVWLDDNTIILLFFDETGKRNLVYKLGTENYNLNALELLAEVPLSQDSGRIIYSPGGVP